MMSPQRITCLALIAAVCIAVTSLAQADDVPEAPKTSTFKEQLEAIKSEPNLAKMYGMENFKSTKKKSRVVLRPHRPKPRRATSGLRTIHALGGTSPTWPIAREADGLIIVPSVNKYYDITGYTTLTVETVAWYMPGLKYGRNYDAIRYQRFTPPDLEQATSDTANNDGGAGTNSLLHALLGLGDEEQEDYTSSNVDPNNKPAWGEGGSRRAPNPRKDTRPGSSIKKITPPKKNYGPYF